MNKNLKILIIMTILAILSIIYLNVNDDDNVIKPNTNKVDKLEPLNDKTPSNQTKIQDLLVNQLAVEPVTDFIKEFNINVAKNFSLGDDEAKINEVGFLSVKFRENTDDVVAKIKEYMSDVAQNQIQIDALILHCHELNKSIKSMERGINDDNSENKFREILFNEYYFNLGLQESKFCDTLGTKQDPLWKFLALARKGNELAQFILLDNIIMATHKPREIINIRKNPIEYMNLRDEAIMYLHKLAARGVHRASEKLGRLFSGRDWDILDENPVLAYYYFYLTNEQDEFEPVSYNMNLNRLYDRLTDKQKSIVDRMTENL